MHRKYRKMNSQLTKLDILKFAASLSTVELIDLIRALIEEVEIRMMQEAGEA